MQTNVQSMLKNKMYPGPDLGCPDFEYISHVSEYYMKKTL